MGKESSKKSVNEVVRRFEASYHHVKTLRATFTQIYDWGSRTRTESGTVYFAHGGRMRWDYQEPAPKLFISDGKHVSLYIPAENQLTRSTVKSSADVRIPFELLLSRVNLRKFFSKLEFAGQELEHDPGDRVLKGFPKKKYEEGWHEVFIELTPRFDVRRLLIVYPDGTRMEFKFTHIERDVHLNPKLFHFVPPPGTEIIQQH